MHVAFAGYIKQPLTRRFFMNHKTIIICEIFKIKFLKFFIFLIKKIKGIKKMSMKKTLFKKAKIE